MPFSTAASVARMEDSLPLVRKALLYVGAAVVVLGFLELASILFNKDFWTFPFQGEGFSFFGGDGVFGRIQVWFSQLSQGLRTAIFGLIGMGLAHKLPAETTNEPG